jgi:DNA-binding transcriptional regulator YiaG
LELSKNPELAESYDMDSIEITIKKKHQPYIQDVDRAILNLQRYYAANKQYIETFDGWQIITKKDLAKMMKVSRPTLDKWLENGFVKPSQIPRTPIISFQIDEVIDQLRKQKQ